MLHVEYERHDRPPAGLRADAHSFPAQNLYGVGLCMQVSEDGVRWQPHPANPIIPYWAGDVEILTYDPIDRKYVLYGRARKWTSPPRAGFAAGDMPVWPDKPAGVWNTRRCVYRLESDDCLSWSEPVMAFESGAGDNLDDGLYGFVPWRVDEMHLGLLNVFHQVDNVMEVYLHHGRDGRQWHRLHEHRPLIPRGPEPYDPLGAETPSTPIEVGDEVWIYYGGMNVHHDWWISGQAAGLDLPEVHDQELSRNGHHLCLATLRLDGWGVADRRGLHRNRGDQAGLLDGPLPFDQRLLPARRVRGGRGHRHRRSAARRLRSRRLCAVSPAMRSGTGCVGPGGTP